jgi:flagellar protein FlaJ
MIEELKKNVDYEIGLLREISKYSAMIESSGENEIRMLSASIDSLAKSLKLVNNSIPDIIQEIGIVKKLDSLKGMDNSRKSNVEKVIYKTANGDIAVVLNKKDKEKFIKELSINEKLIKKVRSTKPKVEEKINYYLAPRGYLKLSNRFFLENSKKLIAGGNFKSLAIEIKRANFDFLIETYIAMMLFTTAISFIAAVFIAVLLLFFNIELPLSVSIYSGSIIARLAKVILIPIIVPVATFLFLYVYPSTEKDSISKKIERELPFATIHMSAISGSGISPSEIFRIIGTSADYPNLGKEIRKVLNQLNLYGYDLVTALNNVSKATPSQKLSELFSGLVTTINSGGSLQVFFEKRAETLLMDYRLEREKYTKVAETFMDIYITVVIAAPMILMLLLVMIGMTGFSIPLTPGQMTLVMVSIIAFVNIIFLGVLQTKQPGY